MLFTRLNAIVNVAPPCNIPLPTPRSLDVQMRKLDFQNQKVQYNVDNAWTLTGNLWPVAQ